MLCNRNSGVDLTQKSRKGQSQLDLWCWGRHFLHSKLSERYENIIFDRIERNTPDKLFHLILYFYFIVSSLRECIVGHRPPLIASTPLYPMLYCNIYILRFSSKNAHLVRGLPLPILFSHLLQCIVCPFHFPSFCLMLCPASTILPLRYCLSP